MCIFSRPVSFVGSTCIYARGHEAEQVLVYAMDFAAADELAMILPLPAAHGATERSVRFIDLSGYATFFDDMRKAFPMPQVLGELMFSGAAPAPQHKALVVHQVGAFEASFSPSVADLDRLDPRFRLPDVSKLLPLYADFGFAVFKLKASGRKKIHPMAFAFERRDRDRLFFPTVHVHDGAVHDAAVFDHELYCQTPTALPDDWAASDRALSFYVNPYRAQGVIDWRENGWRTVIAGMRENSDVVIEAADSTSSALQRPSS
jgi:hypothetical protein